MIILKQYIKVFQKKITIICNIHGPFQQRADYHLKSKGCPGCNCCKKHTNKSFIKKAQEIHFYKYDYSLVNYVNNKLKIDIICPIHGTFSQRPCAHINETRPHGCPKCDKSFKLNTENFIEKEQNENE